MLANLKMKSLINTILFLFLIQVCLAQKVPLITDWDKAKELAEKGNKQILIILTGSEWCAPCKKMDKNVIENDKF
jgi:thioredoxin-related protein